MIEKNHLEPGFLQVFRLYAWLRALSLLLIPLIGLRLMLPTRSGELPAEMAPPEIQLSFGGKDILVEIQNVTSFSLLPVIFSLASISILLIYLHWPWIRKRMDGSFALGAIVLASLGLQVEQHLFTAYQIFLQIGAFFYIVLILVAWQYTYRQVVVYTLATTAFEIILNLVYPLPAVIIAPFAIQERLMYFSLFFRSLAFLVLGYVVTRLVAAQRQQRQALASANQKLVRHAATLEQLTVSRERVRLSRELHDTLAHTLSALAVQIDAISAAWEPIPAKARQMLDRMLETTRTGLDETRRSLSALRASPLEEMGLVFALRALAEDFTARHALELELAAPDNLDDLPVEVEQCFYRVAQEALENITRHARAGKVVVNLGLENGGLALQIQDDGIGFEPSVVHTEGRLGIKGMRERADLIGARLDINSRPGKGTSLRLKLENLP